MNGGYRFNANISYYLQQVKDTLAALFPDLFDGKADSDDEDEDMEDPEDLPEAATVLLDMLLELLHRPSAFVKSVAQTVFTGFADEIGEQAMELLLEVNFLSSASLRLR